MLGLFFIWKTFHWQTNLVLLVYPPTPPDQTSIFFAFFIFNVIWCVHHQRVIGVYIFGWWWWWWSNVLPPIIIGKRKQEKCFCVMSFYQFNVFFYKFIFPLFFSPFLNVFFLLFYFLSLFLFLFSSIHHISSLGWTKTRKEKKFHKKKNPFF